MIICPLCEKGFKRILPHVRQSHGFTKEEFTRLYPDTETCTEESRNKSSASNKISCNAPEYLESLSNRVKKYYEDNPEQKDILRESAKKQWENNVFRSMMSAKAKKQWEDESYRELHSRISKKTATRQWEECREYLIQRITEGWYSGDSIERQSERVATLWKNGTYAKTSGSPKFTHTLPTGKVVRFRSKPELNLALALEKLNIDYDYECASIKYTHDGIERTYFPDFFIQYYNLFVEVKAEYWMNDTVLSKIKAVLNQGHHILLMKDEWFGREESFIQTEILSSQQNHVM